MFIQCLGRVYTQQYSTAFGVPRLDENAAKMV